jgi:hypothetical protein
MLAFLAFESIGLMCCRLPVSLAIDVVGYLFRWHLNRLIDLMLWVLTFFCVVMGSFLIGENNGCC